MVLDQTADQPADPGIHAWIGRPAPNAVLVFPGTLLHGVLPGQAGAAGNRVTLMAAWWPIPDLDLEGCSSSDDGATTGRPRTMPPWRQGLERAPRAGARTLPEWAGSERWRPRSASSASTECQSLSGPLLSGMGAAWQKLESKADPDHWLARLPLPPLRFWLRAAEQIVDTYAEAA